MVLRPGVKPYEPREDRLPLMVRASGGQGYWSGRVGQVRRVTPSGRGCPSQAFVQFWNEDGSWDGHWFLMSQIERAMV